MLLTSSTAYIAVAVEASDGEIPNIPSLGRLQKGNPKLDSGLNQLVAAQDQQRVEMFSLESTVETRENIVRVIVESLPAQLEVTTKAIDSIGNVETSYNNLLQILIPVSELTDVGWI